MKKTYFALILAVVAAAGLSAGEIPQAFLIKNATIVPVVGERLERGDLLIQDGKIGAIGEGLTAPQGAAVVDVAGMLVYPGFIDAYSHFGLVEIGGIPSTSDVREMGKENPELRAAWAINPHSVHFATSRINGTTAALVAPVGGTFPGLSALVKMDGWTLPEMAVSEVATSFINFPMTPRPAGGEGVAQQQESKADVTAKLVEKIKDYLKEARHYLKLKKDAQANPGLRAPEVNPKYEALAPVLDGRLPVIISVEKAKDIELAMKFVQEEKLKAIFRGCSQGFKVAKKIAQAGIPVIIDSLYVGPAEPEDGYDAPFRNVVEMSKAGVILCFSSGDDVGTGKDLPYHAARAVAYGMDHGEAIKALTVNPARVLGVDGRLGSLEKGKDADLFITTGDPLDSRSEVKHLFIGGKPVDLHNWWESLFQKWDGRPKK